MKFIVMEFSEAQLRTVLDALEIAAAWHKKEGRFKVVYEWIMRQGALSVTR